MNPGSTIPTTQPSPFGILTRSEIERLGLIKCDKADPQCFKPASYDLRLGEEYMLPGKADRVGNRGHPTIRFCTAAPLVIPPFSSVLVSTYERVELPLNVVGRFNLRVRMAFKGLVVQMGTQVEPGYKGRLFAIIQNITEERVEIKYADYATRPFTIEFQYTTSDAVLTDPDRKKFDHIHELMANGFPPAINSITEQVTGIGKSLTRFRRWAPITIPLIVTAVITVTTLIVSTLAPIIAQSTSGTIAVAADRAITLVYGNRVSELEDWREGVDVERRSIENQLANATSNLAALQARLAELERAIEQGQPNPQETSP